MASAVETQRLRYVEGQYFDKIVITGVFDVKLTRTTEQVGVEVETTQEGHKFVKIEVQNDNTLSISLLGSSSLPSKIIVHINFKILKSYTSNQLVGSSEWMNEIDQKEKFGLYCNEGTENIYLQLRVPTFEASLTGTSKNTFLGHVSDETRVKCDGVVDLDASALVTSKFNIETNGVGNATVQASDEINARANGVYNIYYRGPLKTAVEDGMGKILPYQSE